MTVTITVLVRGWPRALRLSVSWAVARAMTLARRMGVLKRMVAEILPRSVLVFCDFKRFVVESCRYLNGNLDGMRKRPEDFYR